MHARIQPHRAIRRGGLWVRQPRRNGHCAVVLAAFVVYHHSIGQVRQQQRRIAAIAGRKEAGNRIGQGKCHGGVSITKRVCHHRQPPRRPQERKQR
ncbi:hypothetical protein [Xanthomonas euvesicatoria]|uniref:hypothetical protein n=1 Tax=Xanthomonas euvesicatoria TaxID=456327 RepID=UPI001C46D3ED